MLMLEFIVLNHSRSNQIKSIVQTEMKVKAKHNFALNVNHRHFSDMGRSQWPPLYCKYHSVVQITFDMVGDVAQWQSVRFACERPPGSIPGISTFCFYNFSYLTDTTKIFTQIFSSIVINCKTNTVHNKKNQRILALKVLIIHVIINMCINMCLLIFVY